MEGPHKKIKTELPYDLGIPVLELHPETLKFEKIHAPLVVM